ncbi:MAG: hypothetical protein VXZ96_11680 [Myxococcota bacterium]|nr:hypothetical protein [Myxococcota bacterium]MEC8380978.1 hypothetical protein [Myxococcota bacterium]
MMLFPTILLLTSCQAIQNIKDKINGLTESFVVSGLLWGVEPVEDATFDLTGTDFEKSSSLTVFLANTEIAGSLSANPISRATVSLNNTIASVAVLEDSSGVYKADSDNGLEYIDGRIHSLDMVYLGEGHSIESVMPSAPVFTLPETMPPQSLVVDLTGQGYFQALTFVLNLTTGGITYDSRPQGAEAFYDLTHPNGDALEESDMLSSLEIPASAFEEQGIYLVGIAGLQGASQDQMSNVNTVLSSFIGGKFRFQKICVPDCDIFDFDTGFPSDTAQ